MAETIHLVLNANGQQIVGESTQTSLDLQDSIECLSFDYGVSSPREAGSGLAVGRRQHRPIRIQKRIDSSTPLLFKALVNNEKLDGAFKFYRPDPGGTGTTEQFFTIHISGGYISNIELDSEEVLSPGSSTKPPVEEVTFIFSDIVMTYEPNGVTHEDSWSRSR